MGCNRSIGTPDPEDRIAELPISARLVYKVLDYEGPLTQQEIIQATRLSDRTTRYAIDSLEDAGLIEEGIYVRDARQSLYSLADQ